MSLTPDRLARLIEDASWDNENGPRDRFDSAQALLEQALSAHASHFLALWRAAQKRQSARRVAFASVYMPQPNSLGVPPQREATQLERDAEEAEDAALRALETT